LVEGGKAFLRQLPHNRVGDGVETLSGLGVSEHLGAQLLSVQAAVGREYLPAKSVNHLRKSGAARRDGFARQLVGVDNRHAALAKEASRGALARADAASEAEDVQRHSGRNVAEIPACSRVAFYARLRACAVWFSP
jgi:hypothetical protein